MLKEPAIDPNRIPQTEDELIHYRYPNIGPNEIKDYKEFWSQQQKTLRAYHEASHSGRGLVQMHSGLMDVLLRYLYEKALARYSKKYGKEWSSPISLIALGGYGRGELSPHSDVDLMLLYSEKIRSDSLTSFLDIFNEEIIHPLWDLKITVRHEYRTINHSIADAKRNFKVKNAQLEGRLICGSRALFESFQEKYENFFRSEPIEIFETPCLEDKKQRHRKLAFTILFQEPNIKTGVGGLYDYQTILWLARARLKVSTIEAIEHQGLLSRSESMHLEKAHDFLLKVKNQLHFQNDRANNLLNIESQSPVALGLGYDEKDELTRVRTFMRDYYEQTQTIHAISENFEERLKRFRDRKNNQSWFKTLFKHNFRIIDSQYPKKHIDGFIITNNCLTFESKNIFIEDPIRLLRTFRYAQQYRVELSHEIKELIKESVYLINEEVINNPSSNRCFLSILQTLGEVYPVLILMYELGVLHHFLPEFKEIMHLIQNEKYHQYTVDIHTLNTIQVLDGIIRHKHSEGKQYYKSIKDTTRPWLLYLILLLHDLGKANGQPDYPERGARIAKPILDRLNIGLTQQEYILFMISNDLRMVRFWQDLDIDDPQVPAAFALLTGGTELLNYFYVQTYCDFAATSPGLWNSHKEMLHTKLFEKTLEYLVEHGDCIEQHIKHKKDLYKESIYKYYPNITQAQADNMLGLYPDHYFILNSPKEFDLHIRLIEQANHHIAQSNGNESLIPTIHWESDIDQCITIVTIVTSNKSDFLANITAAFSSCGFNLLEAKTFSRSDQMGIMIFQIIESNTNIKSYKYLQEEFRENLTQVLLKNADLTPLIAIQIKKHRKNTRLTKQELKPIAKTTPQINVHCEFANKITIVEIHCTDQIGLAYRFTKTIAQHGFNIVFSKFSTECGDLVGILHIHKNTTEEITTTKNLIALRECLNDVIEIKK